VSTELASTDLEVPTVAGKGREQGASAFARAALATLGKAAALAAFAFLLFGPIANLVLWSVAERWYTPFKLPVSYGLRYWEVVFRPSSSSAS
jgi:putative spermidine/putrescine transport system permease protein